MFERFSEDARRAIVLAQEEARLLTHDYVGAAHILLGLLHPGTATDPRKNTLAWTVLASLGISLEPARDQVRTTVGQGDVAPAHHIPFAREAKDALRNAFVESRSLGDDVVRPEHLLLGLIHDADGVAVEIIRRFGIDPEGVREAVVRSAEKAHTSPPPEIRLRPMRDDEWDAWHTWALGEYADDMVRNEAMTRERALVQAAEEAGALLPEGLATPGHHLLVAEGADDGRRLGYLWFGPRTRNPDPGVAWLYDIFVEESERGRGIARAMLGLFEVEARASGCRRVELNVFGDNATAKHLYHAMGYVEMARQMGKDLDI